MKGYLLALFCLMASSLTARTFTASDGTLLDLSKGKRLVLIVNVSPLSRYAYQIESLNKLRTQFSDQDLLILGVMDHSFGQEKDDQELLMQLKKKYELQFPVLLGISMRGKDQDPYFFALSHQKAGASVVGETTWLYNKFLLDRNGRVIKRFESSVDPFSQHFRDLLSKAIQEREYYAQ